MAIGAGAMCAPRRSSEQYGLPVTTAAGLGLIRALGARDLVIGALVFRSLDEPPILARICRWATIAALTDALSVTSARGVRPQLALHLGGACALWLAADAFGKGTGRSRPD